MKNKRYLTKSRFKTALECPTKLYYESNKEYANKKLEDPFLKALAKGGFQVGELAKGYFPGGHEIKTLDKVEAVRQTEALLKQEKVIIYEAAITVDDFLIRADILVKNKNSVHLIEVKAKSFHPEEDQFVKISSEKKGYSEIYSKWQPYLYDIAFQKAVLQMAYPQFNVTASLMLADKSKVASVDGLNQMFLLKKDKDGRGYAERTGTQDLGEELLIQINVDPEIHHIFSGTDIGEESRDELGLPSFHQDMKDWAKLYAENKKKGPNIGSQCKNCEFRVEKEGATQNLKSGFHECWSLKPDQAPITQIWSYRGTDKLLQEGIKLIDDVQIEDVTPKKPKAKEKSGLASYERQWLQIEKVKTKDPSPYIDIEGLTEEMLQWVYPFNFIDFETSMSALPFNKGRRPYEQVAFQFSHHILNKDGSIEHASEHIHHGVGTFPNFDFVRNLKKALQKNQGSIFRYSGHENTVLVQIYDQLKASTEKDKQDLCEWIEQITKRTSKDKKTILWEGSRNMIDLLEMVKRFYYHPSTKGSNSIKQILPAVILESKHLKEKYQKPIYGTTIKSHNYKDWVWFKQNDKNEPTDPYKLLGPLIEGYDNDAIEELMFDGEEIKDGGAAATAYAMMQFTQMSDLEREKLIKGLLRYCELDTLAMVMITEHWLEILQG